MNRRSFLKGLGAVLIGLQAPLALANSKIVRVLIRTHYPGGWRERLPFPNTLDELAPAIERLFPGEVLSSTRAYEEFIPGTNVPLTFSAEDDIPAFGFGMAQIKAEGVAIPYLPVDVQRYVHQTFALGYFLQSDREKNALLERALIRSHYQIMLMISQRPENQGATLIWRRKPEASENMDFGDRTRIIRMRLSLKQNGWRERMGVATRLESPLLKAEGAKTMMTGA